jgi:hypothetical protein
VSAEDGIAYALAGRELALVQAAAAEARATSERYLVILRFIAAREGLDGAVFDQARWAFVRAGEARQQPVDSTKGGWDASVPMDNSQPEEAPKRGRQDQIAVGPSAS